MHDGRPRPQGNDTMTGLFVISEFRSHLPVKYNTNFNFTREEQNGNSYKAYLYNNLPMSVCLSVCLCVGLLTPQPILIKIFAYYNLYTQDSTNVCEVLKFSTPKRVGNKETKQDDTCWSDLYFIHCLHQTYVAFEA